jgi:hypothetical protein
MDEAVYGASSESGHKDFSRVCNMNNKICKAAEEFDMLFADNRRGVSGGIATGYELDGRGSIKVGARYFSPIHRVQTGSMIHPVSYPMSTWGSFLGDKATGAIWCRGQEWCSYTSTPQCIFTAYCLIN